MTTYKLSFDAVFWIQADDVTKLKEGFSQIAIMLNLEDKGEAKDQVVSTNLVKHWLDSPTRDLDAEIGSNSEVDEADWLLIFDNVDNIEDLREFWPEFAKRGSVLLTSRDPLANINIYTETAGIDLEPFGNEEAARFLVNLTYKANLDGDAQVPNEAKAVIERFGGLPLALEQMASVMQRKGLDFSEFLKKYDSEKHLRELTTQSVRKIGFNSRGSYSHTLKTVWALGSR